MDPNPRLRLPGPRAGFGQGRFHRIAPPDLAKGRWSRLERDFLVVRLSGLVQVRLEGLVLCGLCREQPHFQPLRAITPAGGFSNPAAERIDDDVGELSMGE